MGLLSYLKKSNTLTYKWANSVKGVGVKKEVEILKKKNTNCEKIYCCVVLF